VRRRHDGFWPLPALPWGGIALRLRGVGSRFECPVGGSEKRAGRDLICRPGPFNPIQRPHLKTTSVVPHRGDARLGRGGGGCAAGTGRRQGGGLDQS
jgi:hypothetical protein